ncbi:hypothetical protein BDW74DRAFT_182969 [Aspergillus multicolor]|uniref:uncharacterized protein n=1 Tax=Aspergillus multicolor TaxID=41759 RepID=UPI003CCD1754
MPLSDFKLRDTWHASAQGHAIPDFVLKGGKGGRFDPILAHRYALTSATMSTAKLLLHETPRLLAQFRATRAVPRGQRVAYNKFLVTTLRSVEGFVERELQARQRNSNRNSRNVGGSSGTGFTVSTAERDDVFTRYAAFLNFVEVQGGRRFSLLGIGSGESIVRSGRREPEEEVEGEDESEEGKVSLTLSPAEREKVFRAQRRMYKKSFELDGSEDGSDDYSDGDWDVDREMEVNRTGNELQQDKDVKALTESTWRYG